MIADQLQRQKSLDPEHSFIVQAPAGSGKTELLTRRFLALLARVNNPEEILAITFTRKAAAQMRARIIAALQAASNSVTCPESESEFERESYELAQAANARDKECGWNLLEEPARLRVQTIDSLCSSLVRQMPVLAGTGALPLINDDATELYDFAAEEMLLALLDQETDDEITLALDCLLEFFDNRVSKIKNLISEMLAKRDQWGRHIYRFDNSLQTKADFESVLQRQIQSRLHKLLSVAPTSSEYQLCELLGYAAGNLRMQYPEAYPQLILDSVAFPDAHWSCVAWWKQVAGLILTKDGKLRARITKKEGFPAGNKVDAETYGLSVAEIKAKKQEMLELFLGFSSMPEFLGQLQAVRQLPESGYSTEQWRLLDALTQLLKIAEAYLQVVFSDKYRADFTEIAARADSALGDEDQPTELALSLDYRIQHLLVDEFQDTSVSQFKLFEKLMAGWQQNDGHTFFAVGDPMQSIYRFREARVGLFIQAREKGINDVTLQPLTLSLNFRSSQQIVDWVNESFCQIFPLQDNMHSGAVRYTESDAFNGRQERSFVKSHLLANKSRADEAEFVARICQETLQNTPENTIAILLRSKSQAQSIVFELRRAGIRYCAVDIDPLHKTQVVQDIVALLRAMLHPADRIHWLAVLRAPWCGLLLADIFILLEQHKQAPVWVLINDEKIISRLSQDARVRLNKLRDIFTPFMYARLRGAVSPWLEYIWLQVGGNTSYYGPTDYKTAEVCFTAIREFESQNSLLDNKRLDKKLQSLFAPADTSDDISVQIMTIHKSKGLEFDTVILPGLDRQSARDSKRLLNWTELAGENDAVDLLVAPIDDVGESNPILNMVMDTERTKAGNELQRLLYVASTRARKRLYLIAIVSSSASGEWNKPKSGSLLNVLLPVMQTQLDQMESPTDKEDESDLAQERAKAPLFCRLPLDWSYDASIHTDFKQVDVNIENTVEAPSLEFIWASDIARHIGKVVHQQLQRIAEDGLDRWNDDRITTSKPFYEQQLLASGIGSTDLQGASQRIVYSLKSTVNSKRGRWILDKHKDRHSEFSLTGSHLGKIVNIVIDRTFIDDTGMRWIIDFKAGEHRGSGLEQYLDQEVQRYKTQLGRYADMIRLLDPDKAVSLGLYFPAMDAWRAWLAK